MKTKYSTQNAMSLLLAIFLFSQAGLAQTEQQELSSTILAKDSLFWRTYNNCDTSRFKNFFTNDVEFYHDKGGLTLGLEAFASSFKQNLCSNNDFRLRREVVAGTVSVFPLQKSDIIYGAILSGEHVFYVLEQGKKERLDGHARFTHVWLLKEGNWKMSRILSYDHGPAKGN
ncbi:MAG: nuclear transport factor 2 family protein [Chitinophagaceae bacterium]